MWLLNLVPSFTASVSLGHLLHFSELEFPHLSAELNVGASLIGLL